ncbi:MULTISPECIES: alpha/beta hydrolase [unclassified Cellulophaga]|uniref:alpha/beta hydrolase n=1 Tax=unclassified Cellulophaga TaxID=2634405 RepID=UPI000C2B80A8|nr:MULTISPECIES: esterase [unclassified Cellulophaga]MDO6491529.1 esterase [Cellulophaga sp. 2_MG-2023]MDO6493406.1 esterase [Cellulophaga sp. 3_MG-2023]PKB44605.1 serine hydrolase FSH1 [Cellulophaga sp. RHA19]
MQLTEKEVTYTTTNSYATLNTLTKDTKNVWLVCHGIGYLSKYFLRYFKELNTKENYIIAPQAPSKYYLNNKFTHIGASWLTRENTVAETKNIITYLNTVYKTENIPEHTNFIVLGYSQGVSVVTRWLAQEKIKCNHFVLYAGTVPKELSKEDFTYLSDNKTKTTYIVGDEDAYFDDDRKQLEKIRIKNIIDPNTNFITFKGVHEVKKEIINSLVE